MIKYFAKIALTECGYNVIKIKASSLEELNEKIIQIKTATRAVLLYVWRENENGEKNYIY